MTMFSAENRQLYGGYGGGYAEGFCVMSQIEGDDSDLVVGPSMAEGESRNDEKAESSSKDVQEDLKDEGWLQLSIGGHTHHLKKDDDTKNGSGLIELELLPNNNNNNNNNNNSNSRHSEMRPFGLMPEFRAPRPVMNFASSATGFSPSIFLQHPSGGSSTSNFPQQQEINWGFRPIPISIAAAAASSSSLSSFSTPSSLMGSSSYFSRPFQLYTGIDTGQGTGIDFRVIQPPRRPHSGIWFMLQASQNQENEQILPQISKSYLRIKDGRMTIRLVIKYLVNKLTLENESEIEIRCKGQKLLPSLTLQHVRDNIWSSSPTTDFITLLPNSSTTHHIMVLHYATTTSN